MYRSIVVGTDGSASARNAVARAAELATAGSGEPATVHLVSAYQPLGKDQIAYLQEAVPPQFRDKVTADMAPRVALAEAARLLDLAGVAHTEADVHSAPADAIRGVAHEADADLIIVGSRGLGSSHRLRTTGSVASSLAHGSTTDVLIVQPADDDEESETSALGRLGEAASRFESDHPDLVKTVSDISYYLSGLGI